LKNFLEKGVGGQGPLDNSNTCQTVLVFQESRCWRLLGGGGNRDAICEEWGGSRPHRWMKGGRTSRRAAEGCDLIRWLSISELFACYSMLRLGPIAHWFTRLQAMGLTQK